MNKGQSLFEVVVSLAISALIITAVVSLVSNSIRNATFSKNKTLAARYAEKATEWLRGERDNDPALFVTNVQTSLGSPRCFNDLSWSGIGACSDGEVIPDTILTREITFSVSLVNGKDITQADVIVFWNDAQGYHEVRSATNFGDWRQR